MNTIWKKLYKEATKNNNSKAFSPFIKSGDISCAVLSTNDNIYTGKNILSNTSINMCAEKNAIANMINNNEYKITKIVLVNELGELIKPCQTCYEYLLAVESEETDIEILLDLKEFKTIKLKELLPDWWGTFRVQEEK